VNFKVEKVIPDKQGKFIILKLSLEEKAIVLVNIYAPNDAAQQVAFFKRLNQQLEEFAQDTIVIGGDFNCALTSYDKRGGKSVSNKSAVIQEIIKFTLNNTATCSAATGNQYLNETVERAL